MSILLLELVEAIRDRLDDYGGDRGPPSPGYYALWQEDDTPCLWKNRELVRYIKLAIRDVADRVPWDSEWTDGVSPSSAFHIPVVVGNPEVRLSSGVRAVEQITLESTGRVLTKTESSRIAAECGAQTWISAAGTPTHYFEPRRLVIRLYPSPVVADNLIIRAKHEPFTCFEWSDIATESDPSFEICIPNELSEALVVSACRQAYNKRDAETYDANLAREQERLLLDLIGPPVSWKQKEARRHNANLDLSIRGHPYAASRYRRFED